jgi:uncharacterized OsmC-like protein/catechol 2,3-dioxygenase-like lactoylglutathione lyase family enzyme
MAIQRAEAGTSAVSSGPGENGWVTTRIGAGYRTDVDVREHHFVADEPTKVGGTDTGPTPYDYLLGALGACTAMTLRMYANRKGWPLEDAIVRLRDARSYAEDCENCAKQPVGIRRIERQIELKGALTDEQRDRLLAIADRCPIKQTLERGLAIVSADDVSPSQTTGTAMLQTFPIYAYIPVKNVARARAFYEQKLGLEPGREVDGGVSYQFADGTAAFMYPTPNAGTSKASQAFWTVDDIEREVAALKARGVTFEEYDMPGLRTVNSIATGGGAKSAWFKDTEGNILALIQDD